MKGSKKEAKIKHGIGWLVSRFYKMDDSKGRKETLRLSESLEAKLKILNCDSEINREVVERSPITLPDKEGCFQDV